jgi:hypothetical protein
VRGVGRLDPPQQHFKRHAGKRAAGPSAGENIVAGAPGVHFLEDRERVIGQRSMLARRLRRRGHLDKPLPKCAKLTRGHHSAMP